MNVVVALFPILLLLAAAVQADETVVRPEFETYEIAANEPITITFLLEGAAAVYAVDVRASFDPQLVEVIDADAAKEGVQVAAGQFPQPDFIARQEVDPAAGTIRYAITQVNPTLPANGDGVLFSVQLRGKGVDGTGELAIDLVEMANRSGELLPLQWQGAQIAVSEQAGSSAIVLPTIASDQPASPTPFTPATATQAATALPATASAVPNRATMTPNPTVARPSNTVAAPGLTTATADAATANSLPATAVQAGVPDVPAEDPAGQEAAASQPALTAVADQTTPAASDDAASPEQATSAAVSAGAESPGDDAPGSENQATPAASAEEFTVIGANVTPPAPGDRVSQSAEGEPAPTATTPLLAIAAIVGLVAIIGLILVGLLRRRGA